MLDRERGTLRYANAGHPVPLLIHADGGRSRLTAGGPCVGVVADAAYEEGRVPLEPGDRLVLFTDGVAEARSAGGEELGERRLAARLCDLRGVGAGEAARGLIDRARSFAGGSLADDATVVVVDTLPSEEP